MAKKPYVWVERAAVISALRRVFRRYPGFKLTRDRCKVEWYKECKNGNKARRVSYKCETCSIAVPSKDFAVDHILPVIDVNIGFIDYNTFTSRLFCDSVNLQGLCKPCHKLKCKQEAVERAKTRRAK